MTRSELHAAALEYARLGMAVFPCKVRGKTPITSDGFKSATTDEAQINKWWKATPNANIGIATGSRSGGLLVIDLDVDDDKGINGFESLQDWEREFELSLPPTAQTITGRGGYHMLYHSDKTIKSRTSVIDGVDVRAEGGYIIAPPSIHQNGNKYHWEFHIDETPIAKADDSVCKLVGWAIDKNVPYSAKEIIKAGGRNRELFEYACALQALGTPDEGVKTATEAYNIVSCNPPLDDEEVQKIVGSALSYPKGKKHQKSGVQYLTFKRSKSSDKHPDGQILQITENAVIALKEHEELSGVIRFNELTHSIMVHGKLPWCEDSEEREWNNSDDAYLISWMELKGIKSRPAILDAITIVADENRYHPVREWLTALKWDKEERMDIMLAKYLGVDLSFYCVEVWRLFMYGAVARAIRPGTKFDFMPVLVGDQGKGKSLFVRRLCVPEHYFSDNFNTFEGDKAAEKLRGVWIAEAGELLALKSAKDVESFKSFITSTVDVYRPPYGRRTERRARQAVLIGTTNDTGFLSDKTGNRRFLPLEIHPDRVAAQDRLTGAPSAEVTDFISQCWAEAYHKYMTLKPSLALPESIQKEALEIQKAHMEDDYRVGLIEQYLEERGESTSSPYVCVQELAEEALDNKKPTLKESKEMANIMRSQISGWEFIGVQRCGKYGHQRAYKKVEKR